VAARSPICLSSGLALANILSLVFITVVLPIWLRDWDRIVRSHRQLAAARQAEIVRA